MNQPYVNLQGQDARFCHAKFCRMLHDATYGHAEEIAAEAGLRPSLLRAYGDVERCENEGRKQPFFTSWRILSALMLKRGEGGRLAGIELLRPLAALVGCRLVANDALDHKPLNEELCDAIQSSARADIEATRRAWDADGLTKADAEVIRQRAAEASLEWSKLTNTAAEIVADGSTR